MPRESEHMRCMEVWGGNRPVDSGVVMPGLDAWVYARPYHDNPAGGDVHYVSSCATGRITRMMVADVSGHGERVADVAEQLRRMMRRYVNYLDQRRFIGEMNQRFAEHARSGGFATAVVTTFFSPTGDLTLSNAGHPAPLIYRAKTGEWSLLDDRVATRSAELPLGIDQSQQYRQTALRLRVGDCVLCYTDAMIEARHETGRMLGVDGLLRAVASLDLADASDFLERLRERFTAMHPDNLTQDDVTLLLFRVNRFAPNVSLRARVLAPFRFIARAAGSLVKGEPPGLPELSVPAIGGMIATPLNRRWSRRNRTNAE